MDKVSAVYAAVSLPQSVKQRKISGFMKVRLFRTGGGRQELDDIFLVQTGETASDREVVYKLLLIKMDLSSAMTE